MIVLEPTNKTAREFFKLQDQLSTIKKSEDGFDIMDKILETITGEKQAEYTIADFGKARADFLEKYKTALMQ